ncbi:hypothetical protein [Streptomyces sp. NPDC002889]|uniref:hypothetical protein n=1 Tax=Streptomyces sp. NPDC002889 TaxID=3364669 RepID=UPI0036A6147D
MTVQIAPEAALVFVLGCVVGVAVFKHSMRTQFGAPARGDLVGAIGVALGVITVLALLLGMGRGEMAAAESESTPSAGSSSVPSR